MTLDPGSLALVAGVALAASAINAAAGGGSLISYPALLLVGLPPLAANVSNTVGLVTGYAGGSAAYRDLLRDQRRRLALLGAVCVVGAGCGVVLLLRTAEPAFAAVVPWLILVSCGLLAAQPLLRTALTRRTRRDEAALHPALLAGQFLGAVYGAFFGAGLGVLTLALLGLFLGDGMQRLNALKGALSLVINLVAALCFALLAPVRWDAAAVMLPASLVGGFLGAVLARRVSGGVLRTVVVLFGVAVAVRLLV